MSIAQLGNDCLVILSGGQDSVTCLYWAKQRFEKVRAITFNYGQRHKNEVVNAGTIAQKAGVRLEIVDLPNLLLGTSPLVSGQPVAEYESAEQLPGGLEATFVPFRNQLFLTVAMNRVAINNSGDLHLCMGVCEADSGGYPDCRKGFISAMEAAGTAGFDRQVFVHTPLMQMSKADSVRLASTLPGCLDALAWSHTCYNGHVPPCGKCHACLLRSRGFAEAGIPDPLIARLRCFGLVTKHDDYGRLVN